MCLHLLYAPQTCHPQPRGMRFDRRCVPFNISWPQNANHVDIKILSCSYKMGGI